MAANQNVTQLTPQTTTDTTSLLYAVGTSGTTDTQLPLSVLFTSPSFTGVPTVPTATVGTFTTQAASTAFVINQGYITNTSATATFAPKASPTFTGTATAANLTATGTVSGAGFTTLLAPYGVLANPLSQFAATTSAQLAGVISDETGTGSLVFSASPTFTGTVIAAAVTFSGLITPSSTVGIKGTATNDSAQAGSIGEYVTSTATAVNITTSNVAQNITSISLTAGDWDVWGNIEYDSAATTTTTGVVSSINTTSATNAASPLRGIYASTGGILSGGGNTSQPAPMQRLSLSTTTTVFLVGYALFAVSTMSATGIISARRRR